MSNVGSVIGTLTGGNILKKGIGMLTGADDAAKGAERAANIQAGSYEAGIAEQRRQFDKIVELMSPYVETGAQSLEKQAALSGLMGPDAYQEAIAGIEQGPEFEALVSTGEEALLQNASATGGLRGGNIQSALAEYRPQILSDLINKRYGQFAGLTSLGQASAAMQAGQSQATGANIANLLAQKGAAQAGGVQAKYGKDRMIFNDALGLLSTGAKAYSGFGF